MRRMGVGAAVVVAAIALLATGCGDDGGGASSSISATATDFEFDPDNWTVIADEEFTIDFTNDGGVEHEWAVMNTPIDSEADFSEDKVEFEVEAIEAGTDTSQSFTIAAGEYQVICAIEDHFEAGMEGTLTAE